MSAVEKSSAREARERAGRIRVGMVQYLHTLADVAAAYAARDWLALGYESWESYVDGEYGAERLRLTPEHRQKAVAELRLAGMSQRAIGTALGVGQSTVRDDLAQLSGSTQLPERVVGTDGRERPATRPVEPATEPTETAVGADISPTDADGEGADLSVPAVAVAASPESEGKSDSGEVIPEDAADESVGEWRRRFAERAAAVREGRESYADFVAVFAAGMDDCASQYEHGLWAALQAAQPADVVEAFVAADPDVQAAEFMRRFVGALHQGGGYLDFDPERVADLADPVVVESIQRRAELATRFAEQVTRARSGLRLVKGGMA